MHEIHTTSEGVSVEANALAAAGSSASPKTFGHIIVTRLKEWQPKSDKLMCMNAKKRMPREKDENKMEENNEGYLSVRLDSGTTY